jgi:hypothetical protein
VHVTLIAPGPDAGPAQRLVAPVTGWWPRAGVTGSGDTTCSPVTPLSLPSGTPHTLCMTPTVSGEKPGNTAPGELLNRFDTTSASTLR